MRVSVIIVNFNVKHFLEQALLSAARATEGISAEIFVVDNASQDGSLEMLREKFPRVRWICNTENVGFATANNQAIKLATGEFILLLNPDTILEEETISNSVKFMEEHPKCGALGAQMLDGSGQFLPESKRGLPTTRVALFKMSGLSRIFSTSSYFNAYHQGHLNNDAAHSVDILAGAYMFMRKSVLDKIGLLDENFFMYGEDIDLSYRIKNAGFENYYLPQARIIHYKGESTKKGSLNYIRMFYGAMQLFYQKHFKQSSFILSLLVGIGIRFGAVFGLIKSGWQRYRLPLLDLLGIVLGLLILSKFWGQGYFENPGYFGSRFLRFNLPLYTVLWMIFIYLSGGYDRNSSIFKLVRGILIGTIAIASIYGFLNLEYRTSRMLILLGSIWNTLVLSFLRIIFNWKNEASSSANYGRRIVVVGNQDEYKRALKLLEEKYPSKCILGYSDSQGAGLFPLDQLESATKNLKLSDLIFCSKDLSYSYVIAQIASLGQSVSIGILPENGNTIISSTNKNTRGTILSFDPEYAISWSENRRNKRLTDLILCALALIMSPIILFKPYARKAIYGSWIDVMLGYKTWVAYGSPKADPLLPKLKKGVFPPSGTRNTLIDTSLYASMDTLYARDYNSYLDLSIWWEQVFKS